MGDRPPGGLPPPPPPLLPFLFRLFLSLFPLPPALKYELSGKDWTPLPDEQTEQTNVRSVRSVLKVAERNHIDPSRTGETLIEVWRDGKVIANIYGSREGLHIVSERLDPAGHNRPFLLSLPGVAPLPGVVVPLLAPGDLCPWCHGVRILDIGGEGTPCPVCSPG